MRSMIQVRGRSFKRDAIWGHPGRKSVTTLTEFGAEAGSSDEQHSRRRGCKSRFAPPPAAARRHNTKIGADGQDAMDTATLIGRASCRWHRVQVRGEARAALVQTSGAELQQRQQEARQRRQRQKASAVAQHRAAQATQDCISW